jgi:hypothetical protein
MLWKRWRLSVWIRLPIRPSAMGCPCFFHDHKSHPDINYICKKLQHKTTFRLKIIDRNSRNRTGWPIGLLLKAHYNLHKRFSSPKKWWHFGLLFASPNKLHFQLNRWLLKLFWTWFVAGISSFQKWFDEDVLDFQNELWCRYFGVFFGLETAWTSFWKIGWLFQSYDQPITELILSGRVKVKRNLEGEKILLWNQSLVQVCWAKHNCNEIANKYWKHLKIKPKKF